MSRRLLAALASFAAALSLLAACSSQALHTRAPSECAVPSAAEFRNECVAADHFLASEAGAAILRLGGNAVDAAVASSFALSVVRPYSCGIGGGGFMVIHLAADAQHGAPRAIALNYRETTPAGVGPLFYERQAAADASTRGGTASGVPGTVAGLLYALDNFGTLDRAAVLAPAIRIARAGFRADADFVSVAKELSHKFNDHPDWKTRFSFVWTRYLKEGKVMIGDLITNPEQAAALELIAKQGAAAFYRGPIADAIVQTIAADHGVITRADLAAYSPVQLQPLEFPGPGGTYLAMPPPSSGGVAMAEALGIWSRLGMGGPEPAAALHREVESFKHAFADRAEWLADPVFEPVPVDRLLSPAYLDSLAARYDPIRTLDPARYGSRRTEAHATPPPTDHGTSHLCAVDRLGNAVACTETINLEFGSLLAVNQYGFCLNDQMDDFLTRRGAPNAFRLTQSERNLPAPGKRPLSSMCPTIVLTHGSPPSVVAVAGASGGPRIITATTQVLIHALAEHMDAGDAVDAPRLHHQWMPDALYLESAFLESAAGNTTIDALIARGHSVEFTGAIACVQLIRRAPDNRSWQAASDPRKGGRPAGN
jgi:gamma-glutamyltranspeptidase/glutathione hydrolase